VLLAQIGRTEMIEKDRQPVYRRAGRPLENRDETVDTETAAAENRLLQLLCEGRVEAGAIAAEDFISPERKALAEKLLGGMKPSAILEEIADEAQRARVANIFQADSGATGEQELRMAGDCLRILHKKRIDERIAALQQTAKGLTGEEKRSVLLQIMELQKERQTAGRKE